MHVELFVEEKLCRLISFDIYPHQPGTNILHQSHRTIHLDSDEYATEVHL